MQIEPTPALDAIAHEVIGAAITVHRELGPGFLEGLYESALALELLARSVPFARQVRVPIYFKGEEIGEQRLDLLVADQLIVELKAVDLLAPIHHAQCLSYLRACNLPLGILINFNTPVLRQGIKRIINPHALTPP